MKTLKSLLRIALTLSAAILFYFIIARFAYHVVEGHADGANDGEDTYFHMKVSDPLGIETGYGHTVGTFNSQDNYYNWEDAKFDALVEYKEINSVTLGFFGVTTVLLGLGYSIVKKKVGNS